MRERSRYLTGSLVVLTSLFVLACPGTSSVYVGVSAPGPWYGYPGMYPGGGVYVGVPVCCEDEDAMAPVPESGERYARSGDLLTSEERSAAPVTKSPAGAAEEASASPSDSATDEQRGQTE